MYRNILIKRAKLKIMVQSLDYRIRLILPNILLKKILKTRFPQIMMQVKLYKGKSLQSVKQAKMFLIIRVSTAKS
jgi:hypothetical protein